jgi:hypothetical protein
LLSQHRRFKVRSLIQTTVPRGQGNNCNCHLPVLRTSNDSTVTCNSLVGLCRPQRAWQRHSKHSVTGVGAPVPATASPPACLSPNTASPQGAHTTRQSSELAWVTAHSVTGQGPSLQQSVTKPSCIFGGSLAAKHSCQAHTVSAKASLGQTSGLAFTPLPPPPPPPTRQGPITASKLKACKL